MIYGRIKFNTKEYCFKEYVEDKLQAPNLEQLQSIVNYDLFTEHTDQNTYLHQRFYRSFESSDSDIFFNDYHRLIKKEILPWIQQLENNDLSIVYQARPTFRIHLSGNLAVGSFHKDADFGHSIHELNVFMPLTKAYGNNTFWYQNADGTMIPMESEYGELVIWNGANVLHGNYVNNTEITRVSFDFRFITKDKFSEEGKVSITQGKRFSLGDYWTE